ncbi:MAG: hypothetical protein IT466_04490 [Moraxellaceae bacterium]|nr:hypothetical protein [Moraxellaceae bacterium]
MSMESTKRRLPKILTRELLSAYAALDELGREKTDIFLKRYRRNQTRYIAANGLFSLNAPVHGLEFIPHEWHSKIANLDAAWQKIHRFDNDGAEDYVSADVVRVINIINAGKPRRSTFTDDDLIKYLARRNFDSCLNIGSIISSAAEHFDVTTRTIERRRKKLGL